MNKVDGLHHLAFATGNMKEQIEFFTDKLGMELVALYWMHGVADTWHGFLRLNDESSIAMVCNPKIGKIEATVGLTHAGTPGGNCAPGALQHLALRVKDHDELLAMRDRLREKGVPVVGPMDHGFCVSIYFAGPENLVLELSYSNEPIDHRAWIDPEVQALAGISDDDLARYTKSVDYADKGGSVAQPSPDSPGPHMTFPTPELYERFISVPDEVVWENSENAPPVNVSGAFDSRE